jgi:hypothetical protein
MILFDPRWVRASKVGNNVAGKRAKKKKQTSLCSGNVAGGRVWHRREIKPKESKYEEGHIALGVEGHLALG